MASQLKAIANLQTQLFAIEALITLELGLNDISTYTNTPLTTFSPFLIRHTVATLSDICESEFKRAAQIQNDTFTIRKVILMDHYLQPTYWLIDFKHTHIHTQLTPFVFICQFTLVPTPLLIRKQTIY